MPLNTEVDYNNVVIKGTVELGVKGERGLQGFKGDRGIQGPPVPLSHELGDDPDLAVSQKLLTDSIADMEQSNEAAVMEATHQAGLAEAARDAAFVNADVYPDVAAGLAAVADGDQFQVLSDEGLEYRRYRKDSATEATEVGEGFPTPKQVEGAVQQAGNAADRAEAARDGAFVNADVYPDVAAGRAAVVNGEQFQVVTGEEIIRYRRDSASTQSEVARYPSARSVREPNWAGKTSGWPDPFFRHLEVGEEFADRIRWGSTNTPGINTWGLTPNPIFNGRALRKQAGTGLSEASGPMVYLDEVGAAPGETVTLRLLVVGDGAEVLSPGRASTAGGAGIGNQVSAKPRIIIASSSPQLMTLTVPTTADTTYIQVYPYTMTEGKGFDVLAFWAHRGAVEDGPSWPIVSDEWLLTTVVETIKRQSETIKRQADEDRRAINYAVMAYDRLVFDSSTTTLDVANSSVNQIFTLPFRGWGSVYSPAGISFNAIQAAYVSRSPSTENSAKWSKVFAIVKGGGSDGNNSPIIAQGEIAVNPNQDILENLTIMLTDPTSGEPITLDDSVLGSEYFIGIYAGNSEGGAAAMSQVVATQPNDLGSVYYLTTNREPASSWPLSISGGSVGFRHLLLVNPKMEYSFKPTDQFKADVGGSAPEVPELLSWIPPKVYVTQGVEGSIYLDGLTAGDVGDYFWSFSGTSHGSLQEERWVVNSTGNINPVTVTIRAHNKETGAVVYEKQTQIQGSAESVGASVTRKVQLIGDSLAATGAITQAMLDNASSDVMGLELVGTRGSGLNRHEGRGGWRTDDYATAGRIYYRFDVTGVVAEPAINSTKYTNNGAEFTVQEVYLTGGSGYIVCSVTGGTPAASGTLTRLSGAGDATIPFSASSAVSGNPFWVGGALNYSAYLSDNGLATPDVVFIALGVNDVFGQSSDLGAKARAAEQFTWLDNLITSIKSAGVGTVAIVPVIGPSGSQDGFAANYGASRTRWRVKRNNLVWNQELIDKYSGLEASGTYIAPAGLNWDTVNNASRAAAAPVNSRSSVMVERLNNGVHPALSGYQQIGDAMWAFLKCTA